MAETPPQPPVLETETEPPQQQQPPSSEYWCYHCDKRVSVETLTNITDLICCECKNGFVESIAVSATPTSPPTPTVNRRSQQPSFSQQFLQVLRLIAQSARDEDSPPTPPQLPDSASDPPPPPSEGDDFLRIELDGWDNDDDDDEDELEFGNIDADRSDDEIGEEEDDRDREDNEGDLRRRRREILRLRIRDFASRATSGRNRNRILDWSEILMGLEDNSIELRMEMPESDGYIGNPEDYVDAAGYEVLLQNLADSDGARRGAPPAARSAVSALETVEITPEEEGLVCAICKEIVPVGKTARKLPCGHGYHGDCIVPWLDSRNSCPVCRFELPTDDPEYEEQRKKRSTATVAVGPSNSGSNPQ